MTATLGRPARAVAAPAPAARMRSSAAITTDLGADGRTRLVRLRSEAPQVLRPARPGPAPPLAACPPAAAHVWLTAGAAGPVGGDRLTFQIDVGAGSALLLTQVAATLLLPAVDGALSRTEVRITVAEGGTLIWMPEPIIVASGADHVTDVQVELAADARFVLREEVLLGRHGETGGQIEQRLQVSRAGRPCYRQDLALGTPDAATPAISGAHRASGSLLVLDPGQAQPPGVRLPGLAAVLALAGGGSAVTALAADNLALRRHLDAALRALTGTPTEATTRRTP